MLSRDGERCKAAKLKVFQRVCAPSFSTTVPPPLCSWSLGQLCFCFWTRRTTEMWVFLSLIVTPRPLRLIGPSRPLRDFVVRHTFNACWHSGSRLVICALATPEHSGEITAYSYSNCFFAISTKHPKWIRETAFVWPAPSLCLDSWRDRGCFFFFLLCVSPSFLRQQDDGYSCALCGAMIHPTTPENNWKQRTCHSKKKVWTITNLRRLADVTFVYGNCRFSHYSLTFHRISFHQLRK